LSDVGLRTPRNHHRLSLKLLSLFAFIFADYNFLTVLILRLGIFNSVNFTSGLNTAVIVVFTFSANITIIA